MTAIGQRPTTLAVELIYSETRACSSQRIRPNLVPCPNLVLFVSTTVCCAGRSATRYRAAREPLPRVTTAFQGSKCLRGGLKRSKYEVKARYQVRVNACYHQVWLVDGLKVPCPPK